MTDFTLHSTSSAPEGQAPAQQEFGMIPGLYAVMAAAPGLGES